MFNKREKKIDPVKSSIMCIVIFSLLAVLWFYINRDIIFNNIIDFYKLESSEQGIQKDKYVSLKVKYVLGNYAVTKHYAGGIFPIGKEQHFILLLENGGVISLKIRNKKQISRLNEIYNETEKSLTKNMTVKGVIHTLSPKIENYYVQSLEEFGITYENHNIYYVELDTTSNFTNTIVYLSFILLFIALGIFRLTKELKKKRNT